MINSDSIEMYDYDLPANYIAEYPLEKRDHSKLLVYKNGRITDSHFFSIEKFLEGNSLLVFNDTRVVQARFLFQTDTGATIELFSLEPLENVGGDAQSLQSLESVVWKCFVGNVKRWKQAILQRIIENEDGETIYLYAELLDKKEDYYIIRFKWSSPGLTFSDILLLFGNLPLPPYMKRKAEDVDKIRYQTVYSKEEGSVAAPTAGLHFTDELLQSLLDKGIQQCYVTLHVGAGTFKPVKTDSIMDHIMHGEYINVSKEFVEKLLNENKHIIVSVGTTSMRTIESLYWLGCKMYHQPDCFLNKFPELTQWEAYSLSPVPVDDAIQSILNYIVSNKLQSFSARTSILIKPGYAFKISDAIITNFHQPKSTLLCLVSSFVGIKPLKEIYQYALKNNYRFLSFGDSSLLFREDYGIVKSNFGSEID